MTHEKTIVTIDGPAGAGKSTLARMLARRLGFRFLDTGAMYRAVTVAAIEAGVDVENDPALRRVVAELPLDLRADGKVFLGARDVTTRIREAEITANVSKYSAALVVREGMTALQRKIGAAGNLVCEGRDMGTVVFPNAGVKFYLDASPRVRAERRKLELEASGRTVDIEELVADIERRDHADSKRAIAPLVRVPSQIHIDSSGLDPDLVLERMLTESRRVLGTL